MNNIVSIIIILKNETGISDTLEGINKQDYQGNVEVIIVDRSTIAYNKTSCKYPLRWIKYFPNGKKYTIPEQRNLGIRNAIGDIVVFIDAGCTPKKNWLTQMLIPIIYESESIVAGLSLSKSKLTPRDRYYLKLVHKKYLDDAPTIALAIKKTVFKQIGHFDETFEYSSDTDLSWRAVKAGIKIRFEPNAILYTDWGDKKREIKRTILYGRGGARLLVKHWRWGWKKYLSTNITTIIYPVLILFSPLAIIYPWYLLIFIALIIKNIREKDPILIVWTNILYGVGVLQGITLILFENTYG